MANITQVNYNEIPGIANNMVTLGQDLNAEIKNAYDKVGNMKTHWHGVRYNELIKEFNEIVAPINLLLNLVVTEIPNALITIANNYAQADTGAKIGAVSSVAPTTIVALELSGTETMGYVSSEVSTVKAEISTHFKNAIEKMNAIETEYGKIVWESEAATSFMTKFNKIKGDVVQSFTNVESSFASLMQLTEEDIHGAETANTVGE